DSFDVTSGVEHTDRVKVESLRLGNGKYCSARRFRNVCRNRVLQGDECQPFAGGKRDQQLIQLGPGRGGAVQNLVGSVIVDFRIAGAAWALLLLNMRIEVPNAIYQLRIRCGLRRLAESLYSVGEPSWECRRSLSQPHSKSVG